MCVCVCVCVCTCVRACEPETHFFLKFFFLIQSDLRYIFQLTHLLGFDPVTLALLELQEG